MDRPVKAGEIFTTFIFDGIDCADMGIYSITNSGTYPMLIEPSFTDDKLSIPAYDGSYYYGTQYNSQQFQFEMFADELTSTEYRNLRTWLSPRKIGKLILSDQPYKYYLVKVSAISELGNYPRLDPYVVNNNSNNINNNEGTVIYTGKFSITFETVGSTYGYGLYYYKDDLIYDALDYYGPGIYPENYYYDSGLLYKDMSPSMINTLPNNANEHPLTWYNPGTATVLPILKLTVSNVLPNGSYIKINNNTLNSSTIINLSSLFGEIIINCEEEIVSSNNKNYYDRFQGNGLEIGAEKDVIYIPESFIQNNEDGEPEEYYSIYVIEEENNLYAEINPLICKVRKNMKDKYFCFNGNGGTKIEEVDMEKNRLLLNNIPYTCPTAQKDSSGAIIPPIGFACDFTGIVSSIDNLPTTAENGDVKAIKTKETANKIYYDMYLYRDNKWDKTNLFTSPENFMDETGGYQTQYLMFGANIIKLDDITISTNFGESELECSLLPRYL